MPIDFQPSGIWFPDPLTLFSPFCHPDSLTQLIMCTIIVPQCTQCDNATKLNARRCDVLMQQNAALVANPLGCIGIHYSPPLPPRCPSMASVILSPARTNVHVSDIPHWDEQIKKWPNYLELHAKKTESKKFKKMSQSCSNIVPNLSERCPNVVSKICQSCLYVASYLSNSCLKVVFKGSPMPV